MKKLSAPMLVSPKFAACHPFGYLTDGCEQVYFSCKNRRRQRRPAVFFLSHPIDILC